MNKKSIIIAMAAIILLAIAAYVATLLTNQTPAAGTLLSANGTSSKNQDGDLQIKKDPRLPAGSPDLIAGLVERRDNSLIVKQLTSKSSSPQEVPQVEIVITGATQIFVDNTKDYMPPNPDPKVVYEQRLRPITISELVPDDIIAAFGELRGTRLNATFVLVYLTGSRQ